MFRLARAFLIVLCIVALDLGSKVWVQKEIPLLPLFSSYPFGGIGVIESRYFTFSIVHTFNTGTAWGILAQSPLFLLCIRAAIMVGIVIYLIFFNQNRKREIALVCILGGALGNVIDVLMHGSVTDLFYMIFYKYSYPVFNVADAVIFCSLFYLFVFVQRVKKPKLG